MNNKQKSSNKTELNTIPSNVINYPELKNIKDGCDYECPVCKGSLNIYQFFNSKKLDYCCPYCETLFVPD